jgi:hypothetical protein
VSEGSAQTTVQRQKRKKSCRVAGILGCWKGFLRV